MIDHYIALTFESIVVSGTHLYGKGIRPIAAIKNNYACCFPGIAYVDGDQHALCLDIAAETVI